MDDELIKALQKLELRVGELEAIVASHRAMISQHQTALHTVAQIMERGRGVETIL